jgi:hypothetical protein
MIEYADRILDNKLAAIINFYTKELELDVHFNPEAILKEKKYKSGDEPIPYVATRAILESEIITNKFQADYYISRDQNSQIQVKQRYQGWR